LPYEESYLRFFKEGKIESEYNWYDMYKFLDSVQSSFPSLRVTYSTNGPLELRGKIGTGIDLIEIKAIFSTKSHFK